MQRRLTRRIFLKSAAAVALCRTARAAPYVMQAKPQYEDSWDSLRKHPEPAWFHDAKFGIFFHWGIYSVPAFDNEWYSRNMYIEGERANKYHDLVFGPPSKFGYKDFIPMFRAEKFNPEEWAELFRKAGAKFAGPVTEHADGFSLWESKVNRWNAARMGPRRDVVGEMARAVRAEGMKFLTTFHHQWLWGWYPTEDKTMDCSDPKYAELYGPPAPQSPFDFRKPVPHPPAEFQDVWEAKVEEVIAKYQPDHVYFDSHLNLIDEQRLRRLLAHYYSRGDQWQKEVGVSYKEEDLPEGVAMLDIERGRLAGISSSKWLTDDAIDWNSWCHVQYPEYKSADRLVGELVDIVSKNGNLLLDITPTANGVIPAPVVERLRAIGTWLEVNGEAIYQTRPWKIYGEGPTRIVSGMFGDQKTPDFTPQDIRFTSRGKTLYGIVFDWPQNTSELVVKSLHMKDGLVAKDEIKQITLLGSDQKLSWRHETDGLRIKLPSKKPGDFAYTFKILLQ